MNAYQQRVNAERLARQAPTVQDSAKSILESLKTIEAYLYWAFDPEDDAHALAYICQNLLDHAHELVDQAHEYRARLKANPPPKKEEETDGNEIPSVS